MTITEFLLARIAKDEQAAKDAGTDAMTGWRWKAWPEDAHAEVQALVLTHSRRTLAECEAKRRILDAHLGCDDVSYSDASTCPDLRIVAAIYADHPDYDEAWRP